MSAYRDQVSSLEELRAAEIEEKRANAAYLQAKAAIVGEIHRGLAIVNELARHDILSSSGFAERVNALRRLLGDVDYVRKG